MANELSKVVDPGNASGTDYTSYNAWEDAFGGTSAGNMISADVFCHAVGRCTNGAPQTASISIGGWGQFDSAHFAWADVDAAYKHKGYYPNATANIVRIEVFDAYNAVVTDSYARYTGLAFDPVFTASYRAHIYIGAAANHLIIEDSCFCGAHASAINMYGVQLTATATALKSYLINNLFYDFLSTTARAVTHGGTANATWYHYNNTICSAYAGIRAPTNGKDLAKNCLVFGCTRDYYGTFAAGSSNNGYTTANATITTAGIDLSAVALSAIFFNAPSANFNLLSTCACKDAGENLSTAAVMPFTDDWRGLARPSGASWDIGCWEYQAALLTGRVSLPALTLDGLLAIIEAGGGSVWNLIGHITFPALTLDGLLKRGFMIKKAQITVPALGVKSTKMARSKPVIGRPRLPAVTVKGIEKLTRTTRGRPALPALGVKGQERLTRKLLGRPTLPGMRVKGILVSSGGPPLAAPTFPGMVIYAYGRKRMPQEEKRKKKGGGGPTRRIIPRGRSVTYLE